MNAYNRKTCAHSFTLKLGNRVMKMIQCRKYQVKKSINPQHQVYQRTSSEIMRIVWVLGGKTVEMNITYLGFAIKLLAFNEMKHFPHVCPLPMLADAFPMLISCTYHSSHISLAYWDSAEMVYASIHFSFNTWFAYSTLLGNLKRVRTSSQYNFRIRL